MEEGYDSSMVASCIRSGGNHTAFLLLVVGANGQSSDGHSGKAFHPVQIDYDYRRPLGYCYRRRCSAASQAGIGYVLLCLTNAAIELVQERSDRARHGWFRQGSDDRHVDAGCWYRSRLSPSHIRSRGEVLG